LVYEALFDIILRFSVVENSAAYNMAVDFIKMALQGTYQFDHFLSFHSPSVLRRFFFLFFFHKTDRCLF
jgi:hypothetical protein